MLAVEKHFPKGTKMRTPFKIMFALILLAGLSACGSTPSSDTVIEQVLDAALKIADFDMPDGYRTDFSVSLMGYTLASFRPDDEHSHLYLIQSEKESDGENLDEMLEQLAPGANDPQSRMTIIETRSVTMRGQETVLAISEGVNSEGGIYRQARAGFQGKGGPALLVFSEPIAKWNIETAEALIASVR